MAAIRVKPWRSKLPSQDDVGAAMFYDVLQMFLDYHS